jgi:nickel-dependent lactate racemase
MRAGSTSADLDLPEAQLVPLSRQPLTEPVSDAGAAVREALEHPLNFPPLRRALTPDDHVAVVVDESLPNLPALVTPILEHLVSAHVTPDAVTLLTTSPGPLDWVERLPEAFRHVKVEQHDPFNRKKLSYLATTRQGRRVYLNRTAVDADQLVVLAARGYDPVLGHGGAEGAVYPALADSEAQQAALGHLSMEAPAAAAWPVREEAGEISWLMGAPFYVQVIAGAGEQVSAVVAGPLESAAEAQRLHDARWRVEVDEPAAIVVAMVGGEPERQTFADLARAAAAASRVVRPEGRIIVVSEAQPDLGEAGALLRRAETPEAALALLRDKKPLDRAAAYQWAEAARRANLYVLSRLPAEVVEELFATSLEHAGQVRKLVGTERAIVLPDAERTLAVVR